MSLFEDITNHIQENKGAVLEQNRVRAMGLRLAYAVHNAYHETPTGQPGPVYRDLLYALSATADEVIKQALDNERR